MSRPIAVLVLSSLLTACAPRVVLDVQAPATFNLEPGASEEGVVARVVDGDTIEVRVTSTTGDTGSGGVAVGATYDVRLLGIDTPESVHPNAAVECFGEEAAAATEALLAGRTVRLVRDVEDLDGFGRLLRYVYIGDEMANARLVANGYAFAYTHPPNVRWSDAFIQLQRQARAHDRGLWAPDTCNGDP